MTKINLLPISNLQDDQSAVATINSNMVLIAEVIETLLSRDGTSPNQIETDLDMNNKRLFNLPSATTSNEPVIKKDLEDITIAAQTGTILPGSITEDKFSTGSVSTRSLADNSVTSSKLSDNSITSSKIIDGEVKTVDIADKNVTLAKLVNITNNTVLGNISGSTASPSAISLTALATALFSGSSGLVPTGTILPFAVSSPPSGYLICDGTAISRTTYSLLFSIICPSSTVTFNTGSNLVLWTSHPFNINDRVVFTSTGTLPTGITSGTTYYVKTISDADSFSLSTTPGGVVLSLSGSPTGTHTGQGRGYGLGNGTTTFNLPDLRGEFLRGFDFGRGIDTNRYLGSFQDHMLQDHKHGTSDYWVSSAGFGGYLGGSITPINPPNPSTGNHGSETRPRNISINYVIKT